MVSWQQSGLKTATMPVNFGLGTVLRGRTLGIWGYGKIGQLVASYGRAFGMNVLVWGPRRARWSAPLPTACGAPPARAELFAMSDVLSVHLRLGKDTRGIVTLEDLSRMKASAVFVNTARAELVETDALYAAPEPRPAGSGCSRRLRERADHAGPRAAAARELHLHRRTSATWSRTATSCISTRRSTTSSTSSRARLPTWSI